jgi:hypothetical protein
MSMVKPSLFLSAVSLKSFARYLVLTLILLAVVSYSESRYTHNLHSVAGRTHDKPAAPEPHVPSTRPACLYCHCKKVYLDVGTNLGVQIRKLYEPDKFPGAPILSLFNQVFGTESDRREVCAIGFEPNPRHSEELHTIEETYTMLGYIVKIFTRTAVAGKDGLAGFYIHDDPQNHDWTSTLLNISPGKHSKTTVVLKDLGAFIQNHLSPDATIAMKMDIEGSEFTIMPSLILTGALCHLDTVFIEWHDKIFKHGWVNNDKATRSAFTPRQIRGIVGYLGVHAEGCSVKFLELDDETFRDRTTTLLPLPIVPLPDEK